MSDEQAKPNRRRLGKIRNTQTKNGTMQKIYMDNLNHLDKDGQPNKYYKGALVWIDSETGLQYQVKQFSIWTPRGGMSAQDAEKGNVAFISINLDDKYEVSKIE